MKLSQADTDWANAVKGREGWKCQRCGAQHVERSRGMQAHHLFSRSRRSTRFDLENGVCVCTGCHSFVHRNPYEAREWFEALLGASFVADLEQRSRVLKRKSA